MPTTLPNDIWIEIIEKHVHKVYPWESWTGKTVPQQETINLSLTNKQLRQIIVPLLYHSLTFNVCETDCEIEEPTLLKTIRIYARARSLRHSPQLLCHVRELSLISWAEHQQVLEHAAISWDGESANADAENLFSVIFDSVVALVARMPRLRRLELSNSLMTPRLHDYISSRGLLEKLDFALYVPSKTWYTPVVRTRVMRNIRHLKYRYDAYTDVGNTEMPANSYFLHVLEDCIQTLRSLDIEFAQLSSVIRCASNRCLPLRNLRINFRAVSSEVVSELWDFLHICPELRALTVYALPEGEVHFEEISRLPLKPSTSNILPNLESVNSGFDFVRALTGRTPVKNIAIPYFLDASVIPIVDVVRYAPALLHQLSLKIQLHSLKALVELLYSLKAFKNLVYLRIQIYTHLWADDWKDMVPLEELRDSIALSLRGFAQMRTFRLTAFLPGGCFGCVGCPVAMEGHPNNRGHPSLQEIQIGLTTGVWFVWIPGEGWRRRK